MYSVSPDVCLQLQVSPISAALLPWQLVKYIHMDKPVLALMHIWPCHVSRVKQGSLENVEVATLVFEACGHRS